MQATVKHSGKKSVQRIHVMKCPACTTNLLPNQMFSQTHPVVDTHNGVCVGGGGVGGGGQCLRTKLCLFQRRDTKAHLVLSGPFSARDRRLLITVDTLHSDQRTQQSVRVSRASCVHMST